MSDHTITSPQNIIITDNGNPTNVVVIAASMLLQAEITEQIVPN